MDSYEVKNITIENKANAKMLRLLVGRILMGSLIILFIGVCSFSVLFIAMFLI